MRYLSILLLLAGCSSSPEKNALSADELAKRNAAIRERCDFIVGPPRDSQDYLSCMEYIEAEMN
jgi:hypothetical protein